MKHRAAVLFSLMAMMAGAALWAADEPGEELVGREVARLGDLQTVQGTLRYMNKEWLLQCEEMMYDLHLGVIGHEGGLPFREGAPASVTGFVYRDHIAPVVVASEGVESRFWKEDRSPGWAGQGERRNAVLEPGTGAYAPDPGAGSADRGYRNVPPGAGRNRN